MEDNKISVIIPVYNIECYLEKCIMSVLEQSYKNIEVILVDDGSKDQSGTICDEFCNNDQRVKVIHKTNGGLSSARNAGIQASEGEYLCFIDGDDYIHPQMIECLWNSISYANAQMAVCQFKYVYENEKVEYDLNDSNNKLTVFNRVEASELLFSKTPVSVVAWNKLYKRSLFDRINYPEFLKTREDEYIIHYLVYECEKVVYTSKELYYYIQRNTSIMGSKSLVPKKDIIVALYDRYCFYLKVKEKELSKKACEYLNAWIYDRYYEDMKCKEVVQVYKQYLVRLSVKALIHRDMGIYKFFSNFLWALIGKSL